MVDPQECIETVSVLSKVTLDSSGGFSITDTINCYQQIDKTLTNIITLSDSINKYWELNRNLSETLAVFSKIILDIPGGLSPTDSIHLGGTTTITSDFTITDSLSEELSNVYKEIITLTDDFDNIVALYRQCLDTITSTESILNSSRKSLLEIFTLTDSVVSHFSTLEHPFIVYGILTDGVDPIDNATIKIIDTIDNKGIVSTTTNADGSYMLDIASVVTNGHTIKTWCLYDGDYDYSDDVLDISGPMLNVDLVIENFILYELITLTVTIDKTWQVLEYLLGTIILSDAISKDAVGTYTEIFTLTDFRTSLMSRILTNTIALTDLHIILLSKMLSDAFTTTDNIDKIATLYGLYLETMTSTSSLGSYVELYKTIEHAITLTGTETSFTVFIRAFPDSISSSDSISKYWEISRLITETIILTGFPSNYLVYYRYLDGTISLTEDTSNILSAYKTLDEVITSNDSLIKGSYRQFLELMTITDVFEYDLSGALHIFTENVSLSDSLFKGISRYLIDNVTLSDSIIRETRRWLTEAATIDDKISFLTHRNLLEIITSTDTGVEYWGLSRVLTDTLTSTDMIQAYLQAYQYCTENMYLTGVLNEVAYSIGQDNIAIGGTIIEDHIAASKFTLSETGQNYYIRASFSNTESTKNAKAAIYNTLGTLMVKSDIEIIPISASTWVAFSFSNFCILPAGDYYIAVMCESGTGTARVEWSEKVEEDNYYNLVYEYGEWPSSVDWPSSPLGIVMRIELYYHSYNVLPADTISFYTSRTLEDLMTSMDSIQKMWGFVIECSDIIILTDLVGTYFIPLLMETITSSDSINIVEWLWQESISLFSYVNQMSRVLTEIEYY